MIQALSHRFRQPIAAILYLTFYMQLAVPLVAHASYREVRGYFAGGENRKITAAEPRDGYANTAGRVPTAGPSAGPKRLKLQPSKNDFSESKPAKTEDVGGPNSPEATSFKAAGADNVVNLFTGDFSYNIPLLNIDGYPVNLFYNGGISMEQEASWVGLGWNINPGSVSRNMRGVPDDFNGTDTLIQTQDVKPNQTWGGEAGIDGEVIGIKNPSVNLTLGFSYNNYLGPEMDLGAGVSVTIPLTKTLVSEKAAPYDSTQGLNLGFGLNAKLSSRSGLTLSPSLNAGMHSVSQRMDLGVGLSTSYNGRTGIKDLNISSQMTLFNYSAKTNDQGQTNYDKNQASERLASSTISFARPSYVPTLRMPMQYGNYSGQLEVGLGMFGLRGAGTLQGYYSIGQVAQGSTTIYKPMVGYLYLENAAGRKNVVMDFNRVNDGEVTPNTPIISAPEYDYDIFTISGEGTGGSIRAYRSDLGFMRDPQVTSKDNNISIGFDIAPPGHFGGNWNTVSSPTRSGNWDDNNNTLNQTLAFHGPQINSSFENVYFRNPGEATVTNDSMISRIGYDNLVRFLIDGSNSAPRLESQLEQFSKHTGAVIAAPLQIANANARAISSPVRDKRSQVITFLNAADARRVGLDTGLKSYLPTLSASNNLQATPIPRVGGYRKSQHISEIDVLEQSGTRYVYGLPVYNTTQKDFTFSVIGLPDGNNLVTYDTTADPTINNKSISVNSNTGIDGYMSEQQIPPYASSFLLTGFLSPDYVDVTGDGITEDDLGTAVKFNYTMSATTTKWRTPRSTPTVNGNAPSYNIANFNMGLYTERRDNKATVIYGEREAWYLHSIESKSMIALFKTSSRNDAKGVNDVMNAIANTAENTSLKLDSILLYSKADLKAHGLAGATPIKTVHFDYSYILCNGTPDNPNSGKLTLTDIYFTFNGQSRASKNQYVFNYGNWKTGTTLATYDNPPYAYNSSDRWGTYKPVLDSNNNAVNPNGLSNIDYPYTSMIKAVDDEYAAAWSLKKILLPSGGQLEISYEADDYAYVQNQRACNMFNIYGLGTNTNFTQGAMLYSIFENQDQNYVYVQLPAPLKNTNPALAKQEIYYKYLQGLNQLAFKLDIAMPKGLEPLTVYANYGDYGVCPNSTGNNIIYLQLLPLTAGGPGPLANASVQFLINSLPGQAFPGYDMSGQTGLQAYLDMVVDMLGSLGSAFTNAVGQVRGAGKGSTISLANSFVRLDNPNFCKYGGGHRVKRVLLKDNWNAMTQQYLSQYGQDYDYTTTEMVNGVSDTISSGVAAYEPGIGSEENPFRQILQFQDKLPLASAQYGAIEMPVLEAFYPAPLVGYSKVTVRSINRNGTQGNSIVRSAVGRKVTEFYTAKDYPVFTNYTPMNNMDYHNDPAFAFLYKETIDRRTTSQGFLVETNDMHGKMKSDAAYSESDPNTPLSYTLHTYKNTGAHGLNDKVQFVHNDLGGTITTGNIGVDMELMSDVREFSTISKGLNGQIQSDFFTFVPFPIFGIFLWPIQDYTENKYRAVTTTKLINYHAIEDSVIVDDKGSVVTTKTLAYDAQTGTPVVTRTGNEFNDSIFNVTIPAYWAYSGMGPAYSNIGMQFSGVNFFNGVLTGGVSNQSVFESGDVLLIMNPAGTAFSSQGCVTSQYLNKLWVYDTTKNSNSLSLPSSQRFLMFLDSAGNPFSGGGVYFRVLRSGRRNFLEQSVGAITKMANPIQTKNGSLQLVVTDTSEVVAASAAVFREKWQTDADAVPTVTYALQNCTYVETPSCSGTLPTHLNPYQKGLLGDFKPNRKYVYYGSRVDSLPTIDTKIRHDGYISGFGSYWSFNSYNNLVPNNSNANWVWNTELTKVNSKGQELETHDALNLYTSAQYGYFKNLPVAFVRNAADGQSFYTGFEDINYRETLNGEIPDTCANAQYVNIPGLTVFYADTCTTTVKAHSGLYDLKAAAWASASVPIPVGLSDSSNFALAFGSTTTGPLNSPGVNFSSSVSPTGYTPTITHSYSTTGVNVNSYMPTSNGHHVTTDWDGYIQIQNPGPYSFGLYVDASYNHYNSLSISLGVGIYDSHGTSYSNQNVGNTSGEMGLLNYQVTLCPGIYHIVGSTAETYSSQTADFSNDTWTWSCSNCGSNMYSSTAVTANCTTTTPIPASQTMLNTPFSLQPGQQMEFSGWVSQDCGTPCYLTSYKHPQISVQFPGSSTPIIALHPSGTIIEGWQRIDTSFFVPSNATTASLEMGSDSAINVYFDDIRIHPFNADMKSYVYDPITLKLIAELDENNYATFYNYDEEGQLIRIKKETIQGIKTIKETRMAKQKVITTVQ